MKLKFSIHYNTSWGETLHVVIEYRSADGTAKKQYDLTMLLDDGQLWTLGNGRIGKQAASRQRDMLCIRSARR